jgi:hypothetical protein
MIGIISLLISSTALSSARPPDNAIIIACLGYRPFPTSIERNEFEKILSGVTNEVDKELLLQWYNLDTNK